MTDDAIRLCMSAWPLTLLVVVVVVLVVVLVAVTGALDHAVPAAFLWESRGGRVSM